MDETEEFYDLDSQLYEMHEWIKDDAKQNPSVEIINSNMDEEKQTYVTNQAVKALIKFQNKEDMLTYIQEECEEEYTDHWNIIMGVDDAYAYDVWDSPENYILFKIGDVKFTVWKAERRWWWWVIRTEKISIF